jgi:tRNA(Arg) A34 adenosine deaminase TadA
MSIARWTRADHERHMQLAIAEAHRAKALGGARIGAVIVDSNMKLVSTGHSLVTPTGDPTSHAEVNAIRAACRKLGRVHLPDCVLYSTLEPCSLFLGASAWAGLGGVVFGADGTVTPIEYYDRRGYSAIEHAACARRDGDGAPLRVMGRVLFDEAAALLAA